MSDEQKNNQNNDVKPANDIQMDSYNPNMKTSESETKKKINPSKTKPPKLTWI